MSNNLGRALSDISDGDLPKQALWIVMSGQAMQMLTLLLPIGFFLGIVLALGRLYKDHEMAVLFACGGGYRDLYRAVALLAIPFFLLNAFVSLYLGAAVQQHSLEVIHSAQDVHEFDQLRPGQFNQKLADDSIFYMDSIAPDQRRIDDVLLGQRSAEGIVIETARTGRHRIDPATGDLFLELGPGERYVGKAGERNFRIISYDRHGILLRKKNQLEAPVPEPEQLSLAELWASDEILEQTELYWRLAPPLTLLVLAFLAVPLAYIAPRQGRYGKIGWAVLVFLLYLNLLAFTRGQLEAETIPLTVNFWWVHGLFLFLGYMLLRRRNRVGA